MEYFVVGLDIGTQQIKAASLSTKDKDILYNAVASSQGMDRHGVQDVKALAAAVKSAIGILENKIFKDITSVYVNIPAEFARVVDTQGSTRIRTGAVDASDIDRAIDMAQLKPIEPDEEIVDIIIPKYLVDDTLYRNPMGVKGNLLEIKAQLVVAKKTYVESIYDVCQNARLRVIGTGLATESAASLLLTRTDRQNGAFLVDVGADTTRISLYQEDVIKEMVSIPLGGRSISKDIAIILKTSLLEAEEMKKEYGQGNADTMPPEVRELLEAVIRARVREILSLAKKEMDRATVHQPVEKVVVYGGGVSAFRNIATLAEEILPDSSTKFITSDIIKGEGVFTVQSSGIAYNVLNTIHYRKMIEELGEDPGVRERGKGQSQELNEEEFFKKHRQRFERLEDEKRSFHDEADVEDLEEDEDEASSIVGWFHRIKNKIVKK